jgi:hypothetical protein
MGLPGFPEPHCPALATLLARAQRSAEAVDAETLRYRLLGYALSDSHDYPAAWLSYQVDTGSVAPGPLLRADPVHLRADQHRLMLFDAEHLSITSDEAQALVMAFNQLFASDGLRLEAPTPQRWYLHLASRPEMLTKPLTRAHGRDIDACLPTGRDARTWHRQLNEVQMLFHDHAVNHAREARGQPLINSVWLWGGGPALAAVANDWERIWTVDTPLQGLARLNGVRCSEPPADATAWLREVAGRRQLLCLDDVRQAVAYADIEAWLAQLERLELNWFAPLLQLLRQGKISELTLHPSNGYAYKICRWQTLCFWRRPKGLELSIT